jgi:hypothetical protein
MVETINQFASNGLEGGVLVALIVKAATVAGLPTKAAGFTAIMLGFAVAALYVAEPYFPAYITPLLLILKLGAGFGLVASGGYSQLTQGKATVTNGEGGQWVATYKRPVAPSEPPVDAPPAPIAPTSEYKGK